MKAASTIRKGGSEAGIALLISIFVLLLISVVAIALIVASGTESSLAGNYRSATSVYYAALAGLEEGRGRLLTKNSSSLKNTAPTLLPYLTNPPSAGNPPATASPVYIINPVPGEVVAPWDQSSTYKDTEYQSEFSGVNPPNPSPSTNSVSTVAGVQGPMFKWVRINAVSEASLKVDFDGHPTDSTAPVFYDSAGGQLNTTNTGTQVLEVTSFAALPNGSQKLLQYLVTSAPVTFSGFPNGLTFSAALTLAGSSASFTAPPTNNSFYISGTDLVGVPGCTTLPAVDAIGVFGGADPATVKNGIPAGMQPQYVGASPPADVLDITGLVPGSMQTPSQLDAIVQTIIQNADGVIPSGSNSTQTNYLSGLVSAGSMSASTPLTLVANGDLDLTGWHNTGYGLLLVTGNLNYDPDVTWNGIIMVVGQGTVTGSKGGSGVINGAVLVARTRDNAGALLAGPSLGNSSVNFNNGSSMGGVGIRYSSCWIQKSQPIAGFKVLSFHEISQ